jgi:hypothetical protein
MRELRCHLLADRLRLVTESEKFIYTFFPLSITGRPLPANSTKFPSFRLWHVLCQINYSLNRLPVNNDAEKSSPLSSRDDQGNFGYTLR